MRKDNEDKIDPRHPALIVKYGSTRKKCRPLDREVFVLGRSPGCDLGLISPEVAPVHCVLVRLAQGWRIRDCSGRGATQVNGKPIHEGPLNHGDVIQVGSFSFEAHLPGTRPHVDMADQATFTALQADREKLLRSRENLGRHALRLRANLRQVVEDLKDLERRRDDLDHQEERLKSRIRDQEARAIKVLQERKQLEQNLADLQRQLDAQKLAPVAPPPAPPLPASEEARLLEIRAREQAAYARHLRRVTERLETVALGEEHGKVEVERLREEVQARDELLAELRERLDRNEAFAAEDRAGYEAELNRYRLELERDRQLLEEQRRELIDRQADLERRRVEVPQDQERDGPVVSVKERIAAVRRLRESLVKKHVSEPKPSGVRRLAAGETQVDTPRPG